MKSSYKIISFLTVSLFLFIGSLTGCKDKNETESQDFEYGPPTVAAVGRSKIEVMAANKNVTISFLVRARASIKSISYQVVGENADYVPYSRQSTDPIEELVKVNFTSKDAITGVKVKAVDIQDKVAETIVTIGTVRDPGFYFTDGTNSVDVVNYGDDLKIGGVLVARANVTEFYYTTYVNGVAVDRRDVPIGNDKEIVFFDVLKRTCVGLEKFVFTAKVANGDQETIEFTIKALTGCDTPFTPKETKALEMNGITTFTPEAVVDVKKLTFPLHVGSFADLFYFSNLEELDLTGQGLHNVIPTTTMTGNSATVTIGGGDYQPCMRRIEYTDRLPAQIANVKVLEDLLKLGQIKKITYLKKSMSLLDTLFVRYVNKGTLELIHASEEDWYPEEVFLDSKNLHQGQPGAATFQCKIDPVALSDVPSPEMIKNPDKVFQVVPQRRSASIAYTTPKEYMWDLEKYQYLKFSVYLSGGTALTTPATITTTPVNNVNNQIGAYRLIWPRIRYSFWGADQNNNVYGSGDNWEFRSQDRLDCIVGAEDVNTRWVHCTYDMKNAVLKVKYQNHGSPYNNPADGHYHYRNICLSLGAEYGPAEVSNALSAAVQAANIVYYFADVRLSQTP